MTVIRFFVVLLALSGVLAPVYAKNCTKGKPCGNTCISMSYTCRVGSGSSTYSSDYDSSDYDSDYDSNDYDTDYDEDTYAEDYDAAMSGGATLPSLPETPIADDGVQVEDIYTGLPTPEAYSQVKLLLEGTYFTEDINVVYTNGTTIRFNENTNGVAILRVEGSDTALIDQIAAAFY